MADDPWRDPARYTRSEPCIGARGCTEPTSDFWGPWCLEHNIERMVRINRNLRDIRDSFRGGPRG